MRMPPRSCVLGRGLAVALPLTLGSLTLACRDQSLGPPLADSSMAYWDLTLDHHAVTLSTVAPYRTLPLVATPRNIRQEPLAGFPAPTYVSENPERVVVTSDGTLIAMAPTAPGTHVTATATLTAENLKHTDSVLVRVVDTPPSSVLGSLSVQPIPPDSAKIAAQTGWTRAYYRLPLRALDTLGAPIADVLVAFRSSDRRIAAIDSTGLVEGLLPGWVNLSAATTAFGITKADTLRFRIGLPILSGFNLQVRRDGTPGSVLQERELTVGLGAVIYWQAVNGDARTDADITFTDPTHVVAFPTAPVYVHPASRDLVDLCEFFAARGPGYTDCTGSGSFVLHPALVPNATPPIRVLGFGARAFPVAGTYTFHSTLQGFEGRIVVVDERAE